MTTYESFFSCQGSQIRGGNCFKIVWEGVELAGLDPLRQESIVLTLSTQVFDFSGTMQACNVYVYLKTLWFSEIATTKIPLWFPFLSGYLAKSQFIKQLLAILASDMMYSLTPRVLNLCLTWKYFYFCAQLHFTSGDPFFLFALFFSCASPF